MLAFLFLISAVGGYLLGSIPFGLVLTRMAGLGDIREIGSGNIGATNVLRTGRKDLALATLVLDAAKAGLALIAVRMLAEGHPNQNELALTAGACAFLGHCYPVWLNFKGGKGVATFFGVLLAGAWPVALFAGVTWIAVAVLFSMSSLASLAAAFAAAVTALGGVAPDDATKLFTAALAALIFWRHRANIARIRAGSEPRINQKPAGEPVGAAPAAADPEPPAPAG